MKKQDTFIKVRLTDEESENLKDKSNLCGLTQSALIRMLIRNLRPKQLPPEAFWALMTELYGIHNSLRIIAEIGVEVSERARDAQKQTAAFILRLQAAVTLPTKVVKLNGSNKDMGG